MKRVWRFINPRRPRGDYHANEWKKVDGRLIRHVAHDCELLEHGKPAPWARKAVETALDAAHNVEDDAIAFLIKVSKLCIDEPQIPRWELEHAAARAYAADRAEAARGEVDTTAKQWNRVTLDKVMHQWRRFDAFVASVQHLGAPTRPRVRALLEALNHDERDVAERLGAVHEIQGLSDSEGLGLGEAEADAWLAKHDYDTAHVHNYLVGMSLLRARGADYPAAGDRQLERALLRHDLIPERAHAQLAGTAALLSDREFLAGAGQPTGADVERCLEAVDYDVTACKQMMIDAQELIRDGERWGKPTRAKVEALLLAAGLDKQVAGTRMREEYRAEQIDSFRKAQADRKAREARDSLGIFVLRDASALRGDDEASEAASRRASMERQAGIDAARKVETALQRGSEDILALGPQDVDDAH